MSGDLHHLAAAYVLDALDESERAAFEAHYPTCEICRQEVAEFRETAGSLAAATAVAPPTGLEASVMDEVSRTRQVSPVGQVARRVDRRSGRLASPALLAAAAVLVLVIGAVVVAAIGDGGASVDDVLAAPDAVVTTLEPTADGPGGTFQVVWSAGRGQVAVIANDLPDPGRGSVYELWAIVGDTPVPAGSFEPDDGAVRDTSDVDVAPAAWGVTIEPAGGSAAPTTPILFLAET